MELGRTAQILDNLIAEGKAKPMIVVMPNGNANCDAAPGEWDKGMYRIFSNSIIKSVIGISKHICGSLRDISSIIIIICLFVDLQLSNSLFAIKQLLMSDS